MCFARRREVRLDSRSCHRASASVLPFRPRAGVRAATDERPTSTVNLSRWSHALSSTLENVLLEELRDLTVRTEVLQVTLGTVISLMDGSRREVGAAYRAGRTPGVSQERPRKS